MAVPTVPPVEDNAFNSLVLYRSDLGSGRKTGGAATGVTELLNGAGTKEDNAQTQYVTPQELLFSQL